MAERIVLYADEEVLLDGYRRTPDFYRQIPGSTLRCVDDLRVVALLADAPLLADNGAR